MMYGNQLRVDLHPPGVLLSTRPGSDVDSEMNAARQRGSREGDYFNAL